MRFLLVISAALALAGCGGRDQAADVVGTGLPGAIVLSHDHAYAAGDLRPDMRFRVGSVTKTFVASVALQLVAEGKWTLDDPIPEAEGIPLRNLLNHTSGIFNYTEDPRIAGDDLLTLWRPEQLRAIALSHPRYFSPGQGQHYSNSNYLLLGMAIERVTGHPMAAELERRIIRPLHLRDTAYELSPDVRRLTPGPRMNLTWALGAGAVVSTADDLARFLRALPPALKTVPEPRGYGFGLQKIQSSCGDAWATAAECPARSPGRTCTTTTQSSSS